MNQGAAKGWKSKGLRIGRICSSIKRYMAWRKSQYRTVIWFPAEGWPSTVGGAVSILIGAALGFVLGFWLWGPILMVVGAGVGVTVGRIVFPVPDGSVCSKNGPDIIDLPEYGWSESIFRSMNPDEIRFYLNNVRLAWGRDSFRWLERDVQGALDRHRELTRAITADRRTLVQGLVEVSSEHLKAWIHQSRILADLRRRWLNYEINPGLQIDFPDMSDLEVSETAQMVKAMKFASSIDDVRRLQELKWAVDKVEESLEAAEAAAGVLDAGAAVRRPIVPITITNDEDEFLQILGRLIRSGGGEAALHDYRTRSQGIFDRLDVFVAAAEACTVAGAILDLRRNGETTVARVSYPAEGPRAE